MSNVAAARLGAELAQLLDDHVDELRAATTVMASAQLGAARLTKFSFNRSMIRRAFANGWRVERTRFAIDAQGRGEAAYRVDCEGRVVHFVAFTTTIDEAQHTDRVVANDWEITAALVECDELDDALFAELAELIPLQEAARLDARVLVLTRGNRSVRFFDSLVEALASGQQPAPDAVADAGYIMRSTAFYGNGKYGMKSFGGYPHGHPLAAPYRAQMLAAWLFRELSYDVVEECARQRARERSAVAATFDSSWSHYFGLGNATGLGLVPYAFKHPKVLHTWAAVREVALSRVCAMECTPARLERLSWWIDRAATHFSALGDRPASSSSSSEPGVGPQWLSAADLAALADAMRPALAESIEMAQPFQTFYLWAVERGPEACEFVVSLLLELDDSIDDDLLDRLLLADESVDVSPEMTVAALRELVDERFAWIDDLDLDAVRAHHYWWVISDNTEEPRRAVRSVIEPTHRDVAIDIAHRVHELRRALDSAAGDTLICGLLARNPDLGAAVKRVVASDVAYGEPRSNACDADFLPLDLQRFQLAMYGMDNFSPKSTDWLRVTLNQGAPRVADLNSGADMSDEWIWPARPSLAISRGERGSR